MARKRSSIPFKVLAGYFLLAALAGLAIWFTYDQVVRYGQMSERNSIGNRKLLLVGEAATKLYEAESLSRQLIQTGDLKSLPQYTSKIDSIKNTLSRLQSFQADSSLDREIDSIGTLLNEKTKNLETLLDLRAKGGTDSYYSRVLTELQKVDESFQDPNYEQRFKDLEPHQRRLLIRLLEYAQVENPEPSEITADSLVRSVKSVLSSLERQEQQYQTQLRNQENELLNNEIKLNNRLRLLLSAIEAEERNSSLQQVADWQDTVENTSKIIAFLGAVSLLVILFFVFLVLKDVSRSQQYRKELEKAKAYAESLLRSREQFMNTVTHDLRSPLNAVIGYTGLMEKTDLDRSQNRYLKQLKKSSDYLLHLVNDLLDLSRLEAGKMSIEELAFNPKNLIEETVENAVPPEKPKEVTVSTDVSPRLDQRVLTDPFRIKQILTNLVSNACKFTEKGSVEVKGWLEYHDRRHWLNIQVKDTGIGISPEQKEKVFEEFSQEDSSIEKKYGGSGLGLAISKKLTHLLKGEISLESETGKGSTFLVQIPVKLTSRTFEKAIPEVQLSAEQKELSVLLVDDEPAQLGLLRELVKASGMTCSTARNGQEALEKLKKGHFDLVLTDIQMPEMDGVGLLKAIQKDPEIQDTPVIALSGQANVSSVDYLKMGFKGSLLKPYSSQRLLQIIEDVLKIEIQKKQNSTIKEDERNGIYSLSEVKTFAGEDQQAMNSILTAFISSTTENLQALDLEYLRGNYEKVSNIAHKMLPMIRQLKANYLVPPLETLERGTTEEIRSIDLKDFNKKANRLVTELRLEIKD
ncbi:hybrid sensor histidine kinase/response regulator [Salinimicrobium soli]|uniref:hybrid sensor histidine kinase/response regulator n=1 Tax=Salinimicrobium soli TaxID=1254399 RepID=UPI003AAA45B2